jgi:hypothetical protein
MHTRVINEAASSFKKELSHHEIALQYEDIKFKSLKSWRIDGYLPQVYLEWIGSGKKFYIPNVYFRSRPFDNRITAEAPEGFSVISDEGEIIFATQNATFEINLEDSLRKIVTILQDPEAPKMHLIDDISYKDEGIEIRQKDGLIIGHVTPITLNGNASRSEDEAVISVNFADAKLQFTKEFLEHHKSLANLTSHFSPEFLRIEMELIYRERPSRALQNVLEKDKSGKHKKVLNSFQMEFKKLLYSNSYYSFAMNGLLDKQPEKILPEMDFLIQISDYVMFAEHVKLQHEMAVNRLLHNGMKYKITDAKSRRLIMLLESFKPDGKALTLKIANHPSHGFMIEGKPIFEVANEVHHIFDMEITAH